MHFLFPSEHGPMGIWLSQEDIAIVNKMQDENPGKDGWELIAVTPIGLSVRGDFDSMFGGVGSGETEGQFDMIAAYFKKTI